MTPDRAVVVLDVGKTVSKLSLWDPSGTLIERRSRTNAAVDAGAYQALDVAATEQWVVETLSEFSRIAAISVIVPVGHGAAAAIVRDGRLQCAPMDYESPIPADVRADYDALRDPFSETGSPALPNGLNLGAQLYWLGRMRPGLFAPGAQILTWPQYWAWLLSGVATSEVTSLGCHSDLWHPAAAAPSRLVARNGWSACLPPVRRAADVLGRLTPQFVARTGLASDTQVLCGIHDSNAALLAARGFPQIASRESTVLSTGTWFVSMRSPGETAVVDIAALPAERDCLVNVDAYGKPLPSARFMGGREIAVLTGGGRVDIKADQADTMAAVPAVLAAGTRVLPTWTAGVGPYPNGSGRWEAMPNGEAARRAAICLYAALVADTALGLVGACERILIEGRFAEAEVITSAIAALRPGAKVYASHADNDVSYGALRLVDPALRPSSPLRRIVPLAGDLPGYAHRWREAAERNLGAKA